MIEGEFVCVFVFVASLCCDAARCVSGSAGRLSVYKQGHIGAVTTQVKLYNFCSKSFLNGYHLLALQGFDLTCLDMEGRTYKDCNLLAGKGFVEPTCANSKA
jgi:hypothetical protein